MSMERKLSFIDRQEKRKSAEKLVVLATLVSSCSVYPPSLPDQRDWSPDVLKSISNGPIAKQFDQAPDDYLKKYNITRDQVSVIKRELPRAFAGALGGPFGWH